MNDSTVQWVLFAIATLILWVITWPYRKIAALIARLRKRSVVYPCCRHCYHPAAWGGGSTLTPSGDGHTVPCANCPADTLATDTTTFWAGEDAQWH